MWPFSWFRKMWQKSETVEDVYEQRGIDTSGWATQRVNEIPYCDQHAAKVLREAAAYKGTGELKR